MGVVELSANLRGVSAFGQTIMRALDVRITHVAGGWLWAVWLFDDASGTERAIEHGIAYSAQDAALEGLRRLEECHARLRGVGP